ncbi:MAG: MBL fold metallo-hydrolase [Nitrospinae bacterium]|nr:MBL fold metallo-hydrolase [Nitrospinota bacterium]
MDYIKFLGTAGARMVVAKQLRSSGGVWLSFGGTNIYLDPGPGALVKCWSSKPKLDPGKLDGVILSHKHLDHSGDVNAIIEAMTEGGFKKKGIVLAPDDAINSDPVIFKYLKDYVNKIEALKEEQSYSVNGVSFSTSKRHVHPVETYGLTFHLPKGKLSFITDTKYFPDLSTMYKSDIIVINTVLLKPRNDIKIDHLSINDSKILINELRPKAVVLTHFGMSLLKAKPWEIAERLSQETGVEVIAARDGMQLNLEELLSSENTFCYREHNVAKPQPKK